MDEHEDGPAEKLEQELAEYDRHNKPSVASAGYDLLPCPFCGGDADFDHDDAGYNWIECSQCHTSSKAGVSVMEDCKPILAER
jgi:hypothetical protein